MALVSSFPLSWAPLPDFQLSSGAADTLGYEAIFKWEWFAGALIYGLQIVISFGGGSYTLVSSVVFWPSSILLQHYSHC